jgi:hypothetical protein
MKTCWGGGGIAPTFLISALAASPPSLFLLLSLWSIGHPWNALCYFSFLILGQSVGLLGRRMSPSQGSYLHRINADIHALMGFEPTMPAFERAKTIHALDRADTGRFTPRETIPGIHCRGGWVGPRAGLDTVETHLLYVLGLEPRPSSSWLHRLSYAESL